jgi:crotonobetainyl-CoA:carnitine CoA-transferase CaiB-like acyl-CoA transferase
VSLEGPLAGVRVLEATAGLAGQVAGFLLGGLGAEVVRIEPEGPPAAPSAGDRVLLRARRSVRLDPRRPADVAWWRELVASAEAVLTDESGPAAEGGDDLVRCRVTTWGPDGHPAGLPPEEPLVAAVTGVQALQWSWSGRPVWLVTPVVSYMTGMLAALGVAGALFARARGAPGQAVEVSAVAGAFALNSGTYVIGPDARGSLTQHGDPRGVYPTYGLYRTADGWLFVGALTQTFWVKLLTLLDRPDLLAHPRLQTNPLAFGSAEIRALVRRELEPIFAARTTADWERTLLAADVPCGPVQSRAQFLADPDARALGLAVPIADPVLGPTWQPPAPAVFSDTPAPPPAAAPLPGADTDAVRAERRSRRRPSPSSSPPATCLEGIRVLDLASFIAGPFCPMLLAELGADVVKVEAPDGDPFRVAAYGFAGWNRGKRSLVLDLKRAEGRAVFLDLARRADVVVDNFRGGVMDRLGIGWETLSAVNARLVHTSITGYGSSGPLAALPGFDPVFQARSGLARAQGGADEPVLHMIAYNDYCAGALGALATVAALLARERTGRGQRVDVSLFRTAFVDQAAHMLVPGDADPAAVGGRDHLGPSAARRLYACRDGWICVAVEAGAQADALGRLAGHALGLADPPDGPAAAAVERLAAASERTALLGRLAAAGVPAAPCVGFDDLFRDPFLAAVGAFAEQTHPLLGRLRLAAPFVRFSATPAVLRRAAPVLGADGAAVLGDIGYDAARIETLVAAGVVGAP